MRPRLVTALILLVLFSLPVQVMAKNFAPGAYAGRFGLGATASSLTTFVPDTVFLGASGKYYISNVMAVQGALGSCPFVPATTCGGLDILLQSPLFEDDRLNVFGVVGFGGQLGFTLEEIPYVSRVGPELTSVSGFIGVSIHSLRNPVEFSADIGPASLNVGSFKGGTSRIGFAVRYYF